MNRSTSFLLVAALLLSGAPVAAQTMQTDPAAPQANPNAATKPDNATSGIGHGDHAVRAPGDRAPGNRDSPPPNPPAKDETVGVGGSVDIAPRDIREPFDE